MQQPVLWTDQLLSDRSTSLFRALDSQELEFDEYARLVDELLDPELAFYLKNSYTSLAFAEGGN
jgi:hypothetical protein